MHNFYRFVNVVRWLAYVIFKIFIYFIYKYSSSGKNKRHVSVVLEYL